MSASREKKKRLNQPVAADTGATQKSKKNNKAMERALIIVIIVISVLAILAFVLIRMYNTGFFLRNKTAAVINDHEVSPVMMSYFYANTYSNEQAAKGFDTSIPLSEQEAFGENLAEYMIDATVESACNMYAIYDTALAEGFEDAHIQEEVDSEIEMMEMYAEIYGFSNVESMLRANYGRGADLDSYKEYLTITKTAQHYSTEKRESAEFTEEERTAYYEENFDVYNAASFRIFSATPDTLGVEADEEGLKACEEVAKTIVAAAEAGEEAFVDAVQNAVPQNPDEESTYDADAVTLKNAVSFANISSVYKDWLTDEARVEGDVTYVDNGEQGYIVLYFLGIEDHNFKLPSVRHILITVPEGSDETAKADAKAQADDILAKYLAGEQTEEAFAELAKEHSADAAETGGLYEDILPGYMVEPFEEWCYDESRQVGDTGIVETEYGYHIMYFSAFGETYLHYNLNNDMAEDEFNAWFEEVTANVTYTLEDGMDDVIEM